MMVSVLNNRFGSWFGAFPCNRWIVFLMLLFSSCAVFYPTFNNELMSGWDDQWQVVNAYTAGGMNWDNLKPAFLYAFHGQYSPLNQCIYTFIYSFVGYTPGYYHAYSLLFHILNSFLVYVLLRKMLVSVTAFSVRHCAWIAFLVSMFFCIHPMQVETVAWASASKMVVSTSCYLCSTYFFIRYLTDKKRVFYLSSLFFFIVSYGFKEQVVTLPLWFLLILFCYGADLRTFKTWRKLIPFFIIALVMGLFFVLETKSTPLFAVPDPDVVTYSWWQRLVFSVYALFEYIWKWLFPYKLLYKYYYPMAPGSPLPLWLLMYPLLLVVCLGGCYKYLVRKPVLVGLLFFMIHIALVLHIIPINRAHIVADRYMYLAGVGLSFIVVYYAAFWFVRLRTAFKFVCTFATVVVFLLLAMYSFSRTEKWHDTERLREEVRQSVGTVDKE